MGEQRINWDHWLALVTFLIVLMALPVGLKVFSNHIFCDSGTCFHLKLGLYLDRGDKSSCRCLWTKGRNKQEWEPRKGMFWSHLEAKNGADWWVSLNALMGIRSNIIFRMIKLLLFELSKLAFSCTFFFTNWWKGKLQCLILSFIDCLVLLFCAALYVWWLWYWF